MGETVFRVDHSVDAAFRNLLACAEHSKNLVADRATSNLDTLRPSSVFDAGMRVVVTRNESNLFRGTNGHPDHSILSKRSRRLLQSTHFLKFFPVLTHPQTVQT